MIEIPTVDQLDVRQKRVFYRVDYNNNPHSSIVDTTFTRSVDPHMHKILAWYDNEWGYSNRVLDLIAYVAKVKKGALTGATA